MISIICTLIACSSQSKTIEKMKKNLSDEGYTVTSFDTILDDIKVTRILAEKDSSYLDVCFNVAENDIDKVNNYYSLTYKSFYKLNSNSGKGTVVCCSDETVLKLSGIKILDLEPIVVKN